MAVHIHLAWFLILMVVLGKQIKQNLKTYFIWFDNNFLLVDWNRTIKLFLRVLRKLIYEGYWFCCLLICRDRNKKNFAHRSLLSTSAAQFHAVNIAPKNLKLEECYEPRKLSVLERRIGPKLKKLEGFLPVGEYGELASKKSE